MKKSILLVDDNPLNLNLLTKVLKEDYKINIAQNGEQCINLSKNIKPDLILLDIVMPKLDGYQTCKILKKIPETKEIPIIFLTAKTNSKEIVKGLEIGGSDYVTKPFDNSVLKARVKKHLLISNKTNQLKKISNTDGLTNLLNRKYFNEFLSLKWNQALENKSKISLILIDIDYFKEYNDTYGHYKGDITIKKIAKIIKTITKNHSNKKAFRFGGEEFAVILTNSNLEETKDTANKIIQNVKENKIEHKKSKIGQTITLSIGTSIITPSNLYTEKLIIENADKALYQSKKAGRNRFTNL